MACTDIAPSRFHHSGGNRRPIPQRVCHQETWCGPVHEASRGALRNRRFYRLSLQGNSIWRNGLHSSSLTVTASMEIRCSISLTYIMLCIIVYSARAATIIKEITSRYVGFLLVVYLDTNINSRIFLRLAEISERQSLLTTRPHLTSSIHSTPYRLALGLATPMTMSCSTSYRCWKILPATECVMSA